MIIIFSYEFSPFSSKQEVFESYKSQDIRDLERQCKTKGLDISQGQDAMAWRWDFLIHLTYDIVAFHTN